MDLPSFDEMMSVIMNTCEKAAGFSKISNNMIKYCSKKQLEFLLKIIELTFTYSITPEDWLIGVIYPVPKGTPT